MIYLQRVQLFIVRLYRLEDYAYNLKVYILRYFRNFFYNIFILKAEVYNQITSSYYWSSTTRSNNTSYAWNVNFNNGNTNNNNKNNSNYVRCVRGGE